MEGGGGITLISSVVLALKITQEMARLEGRMISTIIDTSLSLMKEESRQKVGLKGGRGTTLMLSCEDPLSSSSDS